MSDTSLPNRTTLTPTETADLLNFVLRSTYFQYDGAIYEQQDGAAMGSPVSAVIGIANLYYHPCQRHRRSGNVMLTTLLPSYIKRNDVEDFLKHLHTQQPTISFTMETENDNTIPFLDTLVIKDSEGRLTTSAYKKPTLISTCLMTHTTLNESDELNAVLSSAYTIDRKILSPNHRLPLRKRSI